MFSPASAEGTPSLFGGSSVLRRSPTSPERSCPPFGLWPSANRPSSFDKASRRSPGSRACCFSACAGSSTTQDRSIHSRKRGCRVAFLPSERSQHPDPSVFRSSIAGPLIPLSTLQAAPRDATCKTRGQDGFATLLSCRALSSPTTCRFSPAHSGMPTYQPVRRGVYLLEADVIRRSSSKK